MWPTASNGLRLLRYSAFLTPSPSLLAAARPAPALNHHKMEKKPSFAVSSSSSSSLSKRSGRGRGMNPGGGRAREEDDRRSRKDGKMDKIDALGRLLTRILRHMASQLNLEMRSDGYVRVRDLLQLNLTTFANVKLKSHTIDDIREAVRRDNKQRFSLSEENGELLIRANQGHTVELIESEKLLKPILSVDEVPVCVHGTYRKNLDSILQSGLKRMKRLHAHFSSGLPTDGEVISGHRKILGMPHQWLNPPLALHRIRSLDALFCGLGMRRDVNVLIFLDVRKALEEGMKLYISDNKVILTEGFDGVVPVKYFEKIETWPGRQPVPLLSSGCKG